LVPPPLVPWAAAPVAYPSIHHWSWRNGIRKKLLADSIVAPLEAQPLRSFLSIPARVSQHLFPSTWSPLGRPIPCGSVVSGRVVREQDLRSTGRRLESRSPSAALGKLSPSSIIWYQPVMLSGWGGNQWRRSVENVVVQGQSQSGQAIKLFQAFRKIIFLDYGIPSIINTRLLSFMM